MFYFELNKINVPKVKVYNLVKERVSEKQSNPGREKIKCGNGLMAQISPNKVDFQRVPENKRNKHLMFKEPSVARVVLHSFKRFQALAVTD